MQQPEKLQGLRSVSPFATHCGWAPLKHRLQSLTNAEFVLLTICQCLVSRSLGPNDSHLWAGQEAQFCQIQSLWVRPHGSWFYSNPRYYMPMWATTLTWKDPPVVSWIQWWLPDSTQDTAAAIPCHGSLGTWGILEVGCLFSKLTDRCVSTAWTPFPGMV